MVVELTLAFIGNAVASKALNASMDVVIKDLLKVQDRQMKMLESIHEDVQALVESPWNRSRNHLAEAIATSGSRQREALEDAARALYDAVSIFDKSAREPVAAADLAVVHGVLGKPDLAGFWAVRSFEAAERYIGKLAEDVQHRIRTPPPLSQSVRSRILNVTPPSIEWLWWKNEITTEDQLTTVHRTLGSQAYFVPLRLRLRPAIEAGVRLPDDRRELARVLGVPSLSWIEAKTVGWTMTLPEIRRLYDARAMTGQLAEYAGLCRAFGRPARPGTMHVDLSTQQEAEVRYLAG